MLAMLRANGTHVPGLAAPSLLLDCQVQPSPGKLICITVSLLTKTEPS
jgi:hypothetical protein